SLCYFFFHVPPSTNIYTLSLHDALPISIDRERAALTAPDRARLASGSEQAALPSSAFTLGLLAPADARLAVPPERAPKDGSFAGDRKSTRLNSSHVEISYAVFCLKKKNI